MKENLPPSQAFYLDGCMLSSQTQNIIPLQINQGFNRYNIEIHRDAQCNMVT
jgi:hypothetical protein